MHLMPTQNPRLTITLTPAVAAVLKSMSEASGNSQSSIVGELLEVSVPVFERVTKALLAARDMEEAAKGEIAAGLGRAQSRMEQQLPLHLAELDEGIRPLLDHAEDVRRRRARAAGGAPAPAGARQPDGRAPRVSTPVPVTRGSGPRSKPSKAGKGGSRGSR